MGRKPLPNPLYEPWTPEAQRQFISDAYNWYKHCHGDPAAPPLDQHEGPVRGHQKRADTITYLYRLGYDLGYLKISYKEFEYAIYNGQNYHPTCKRRHYHSYRCNNDSYEHWYPRKGAHFREKVVGSKNVSRKERDPAKEEKKRQRKEWREKKGFQRTRTQDKNWRRGCRGRGFARIAGNRAMRRWEERMIQKGDWEALGDEQSIMRLFLDPWDWD